jgi:hypothetical protein
MQGKLSVWFRAGAARLRQSGSKNGSGVELFFRWRDGNARLWRFHGIFEEVDHSGTNRLIGAFLRLSRVSGLKRADDSGYPKQGASLTNGRNWPATAEAATVVPLI